MYLFETSEVSLKHSHVSLACDSNIADISVQESRSPVTQRACVAALSPRRADSTLFGSIFLLVLWVLFPLEYVLLFYLIVDKVDFFRGSFSNERFHDVSCFKL